MASKGILVVECGDRRQQTLARDIRELEVYSEIMTKELALSQLADLSTRFAGIILAEVSDDDRDRLGEEFTASGLPQLILRDEASVTETKALVQNFVKNQTRADTNWTLDAYVERQIQAIRQQVGDRRAICGLSGGVDSSVAATLVYKAIGQQLTLVFVDHGLMRKNEGDQVEAVFRDQLGANFIRVNAQDRFLDKLAGVTDPEAKRKIIGEEFIRVFEDEAAEIGEADFLVQGTIYPDVLESQRGDKLVKSHHNVGGLPKDIEFKGLVEPLRELFKDEVRQLGAHLGLPEELVWRQPFPGPGLAVRCLGECTREKLDILRDADAIFREEIAAAGLSHELSQYFAVLTNLRSVGVRKGERTYDYVLALRAIQTRDFMTAEWARLPYDLLDKVSRRITDEVEGISRVVYEITGKPPATIEWE